MAQGYRDYCATLTAPIPDLNPIEYLWHSLKLKLGRYETKAKRIHELWTRCDKEWNTFTPEEFRRYIEFIPARVAAVLKVKAVIPNSDAVCKRFRIN